jgi:hypothetical protein
MEGMVTNYTCELRPGGIACGWCEPCRSVQRLTYELWCENDGRNQEPMARHVSTTTGRPIRSVRKLLRSFRAKGDPSSWAGGPAKGPRGPRGRYAKVLDDEPAVRGAERPTCPRCGLSLPHVCLEAVATVGSSAVALLGAV